MKKVALNETARFRGKQKRTKWYWRLPAWTCEDGDGILRPEGNQLLRQMYMRLTQRELRKLKGRRQEKIEAKQLLITLFRWPVTILRPVEPVLRKLQVTFPCPLIICGSSSDSSRRGWAGDLCGDHWKSEDSLHYRIGHDNRPLYLLRNHQIHFHSLKPFYSY